MSQRNLKNQFDDVEWHKLTKDSEFNLAWDSGDFVKAGELAAVILFGVAHTKREAKKLEMR
jgi:hypothetical protein